MLRVFFSLILLTGPVAFADARLEEKSCRIFFEHIVGPTADEIRLLREAKGHFYQITAESPVRTDALNKRLVGRLSRMPLPRRIPGRKRAFNTAEREKLYRDVSAIPAVQESLCGTYKESKKLGFCFGRAFAAHMKA